MKMVDFICEACSHEWEALMRNEEPMPTCPSCESAFVLKKFPAPKVLNAAFLDGTKRSGFAEMKEASKLKAEMMDRPPAERAAIKREIKKVKGEG